MKARKFALHPNAQRREFTKLEALLFRALKLAVEEFDRISYQKKAAPGTMRVLRATLEIAERAHRIGLPTVPWTPKQAKP